MTSTRPKSPGIPIAATVGAVLLLAGCGSSGGGDSAPVGAGTTSQAANQPAKPGGSGGGQEQQKSGSTNGGALAPPAGASEEQKKAYAYVNIVADCMKKAGFTYVAYVPPEDTSPEFSDRFDADYAAARKWREKYGFGAFAPAAYPDDPKINGAADSASKDPNTATFDALPPDRKTAYNTALWGSATRMKLGDGSLGGCQGEAQTKVYGTREQNKPKAEASAEAARLNRQNLNGDAQLVQLAQKYATCLVGKGHQVTTTAVTEIRTALQFTWFSKAGSMAPQRVPNAEPGKLDPGTARTMLAKEITAALDDLDCGKEFRAAYYPKLDKMPGAEGLG